jgi:hypothetical protein
MREPSDIFLSRLTISRHANPSTSAKDRVRDKSDREKSKTISLQIISRYQANQTCVMCSIREGKNK